MSGPLAIVAGGGPLPWEAARAIAPRREVFVVAIDGEADAAHPGIETHILSFGQLGALRKLLVSRDCWEILLLGAIRHRPEVSKILGDMETIKLLPKIIKAVVGGDDTIVRNIVSMFEAEGYTIVSVADAVPELLARQGQLGRHAPAESHEADITLGTAFLDAAAPFDIGQAAIVVEGRIVAVEGAEGTDAMLVRCKELRAVRRFRAPRGRGVLVKRAKTGQDMRADVPVVGAGTLAKVLEAGLGGIAVEANRTIIAERAAMIEAADRAGAFLVAR